MGCRASCRDTDHLFLIRGPGRLFGRCHSLRCNGPRRCCSCPHAVRRIPLRRPSTVHRGCAEPGRETTKMCDQMIDKETKLQSDVRIGRGMWLARRCRIWPHAGDGRAPKRIGISSQRLQIHLRHSSCRQSTVTERGGLEFAEHKITFNSRHDACAHNRQPEVPMPRAGHRGRLPAAHSGELQEYVVPQPRSTGCELTGLPPKK